MLYQLTKDGAKWAIEVSGSPAEESIVKTFGSREDAEAWRRAISHGEKDAPVLEPRKEKKVSKKATVKKSD
jgi:hypothetical protein|tara:strand:+ start:381 stop:593 length:213 start_codon:yes stop_codon:yes gene_type:complete